MKGQRTNGKPVSARKTASIGAACGDGYEAGKEAVVEWLQMISAGPFVKIDRYRIDSLRVLQKNLLEMDYTFPAVLQHSNAFLEGFLDNTETLVIDAEKANGRNASDKTPQQTVPPVTAARDVAKPDTSGNAGLDGGDVIRMDAHRSNRFYHTLAELDDTITSLTTVVKSFPDPQCSPGQIEPRVAVLAFASHMDNLLGLLQAMANNEEHLNDEHREDDHAQG